jgi:hypothetical protein
MFSSQISFLSAGIGFISGWYFMKPIRQYMYFNTTSNIMTLVIPATFCYFTPKVFNIVFDYDTLKLCFLVYTATKIVTSVERYCQQKFGILIQKKQSKTSPSINTLKFDIGQLRYISPTNDNMVHHLIDKSKQKDYDIIINTDYISTNVEMCNQ